MHLTDAEAIRRQLPELLGNKRRAADILNRDLAYLCETQVLSKKDRNEIGEIPAGAALQGFLPDDNAEGLAPQRITNQSRYKTELTEGDRQSLQRAMAITTRDPAGRRWRGRLGPSLFMTAVEVAPPSAGMREHGEAAGRRAMRLLQMTDGQRFRNGLLPALVNDPAKLAKRGEWIRDWAATAADRTALVPSLKSAQTPTTYGWKGLTSAGRRSIRDAGAVMDEHYGSLGFFTATLTQFTAERATRAQIAEFQTRLMYLIRRKLERLGLEPLVLLVAEMHPHRKTLDGAPVPHWHGVVKVSPAPYRTWQFRKEDFWRCVLQAYRIAFGHKRGHTQRLNLLPQLTGCARYLSKYMAKGGSDVEALRWTERGRMVPRQWWSWTGELRALVTACRTRPPAAFLRWCVRWRHELADLGETSIGEVQIGDDGPVVGCWFGWRSEAALDRAIRAWIEEELALLDRATGPPGPLEVPDGWVDADGVVRYGFGGDLPEGVVSPPATDNQMVIPVVPCETQ